MKKTILLLMLSISINIFAQDLPKLELKQTGIESIVVDVEGKTASELYNQALNWVQETYKNPDEVLKAKIENQKIRINGFSENSWYIKSLGMKQYSDLSYSIEISFKDGKYKFEYAITKLSKDGQKFGYSYPYFFKKDGSTRKFYKESVPAINNEMNDLSQSFYDYEVGKTDKKEDDW